MKKIITILLIILISSCTNEYNTTKKWEIYEMEYNSTGLVKYKCFDVETKDFLNVIDSLHKYKIGDVIK